MNIAREVSLTPSAKTILLHLRRRGTISPMEALVTYSLPKVAKQVHELRTAGYHVASVLNKDEAGHRYARYSMTTHDPVAQVLGMSGFLNKEHRDEYLAALQ